MIEQDRKDYFWEACVLAAISGLTAHHGGLEIKDNTMADMAIALANAIVERRKVWESNRES